MKIVLYQISDALRSVVKMLFSSDLDVMSDEVREILSNPSDAKKYREAIKELENNKNLESKTIKLSNNQELTLVQ